MKRTTRTVTTTIEITDHPPRMTLVTFLLDRTGSMERIRQATIDGFNSYLDTLEREAGDLVEFTMLQFDSNSIDKLHVGAKLKDVARLNLETYQPRASTPLYDACVKTIKATEEALIRWKSNHPTAPAPRIVVAIQTDGEENCSTQYKRADLAGLIKARSAEGWEFIYMGANIDAYKEAAGLGIGAGSTVSYAGNLSHQMFAATASNTAGYARGARLNVNYSGVQKQNVGDQYQAGSPPQTAGPSPWSSPSGGVGQPVPPVSPLTPPAPKPSLVDDIDL